MAVSWFGSRSVPHSTLQTSLPSENTATQKQKNKQIESLREFLTGVSEVKRDELYQLSIPCQDKTLTLTISLPPRFPLVGPVVTVTPPVRHAWVNEQMVVDGSPLVKNFTVHSSLGRAIHQIVREFTDHPPEILSSNPNPPYPTTTVTSIPPYPVGGGGGGTSSTDGPNSSGYAPYTFNSIPQPASRVGVVGGSPGVRPRRPAPAVPSHAQGTTVYPKYQRPPLPESFEQIQEMSTEDLQKYLVEGESTVLIEELVSDLDVIKKVQVDRNELFHENEAQANINLSHKPELEEGWTTLQEKFLELETLKTEHAKKLQQQAQLQERYHPNGVKARLKTLVQETETDSEIVAEDFLDSKMTVNEFLQKYKLSRKLYHLRKSKHEKLTYKSH